MLGSSLLVFPAVRTGANIHRASRPYAALLCRETTRFREYCSFMERGRRFSSDPAWGVALIPRLYGIRRSYHLSPEVRAI